MLAICDRVEMTLGNEVSKAEIALHQPSKRADPLLKVCQIMY